MGVNEKMTALADEIRELSGTTSQLSIDAMTDKVDEANAEVNSQADLITQIKNVVDSLPEAGGESTEINLQTKTVTPTTSAQAITADAGYDGLEKVTVNAIPSTYVKPTATKAATTYTPGTTNQTIAADTYCSGVQTIKGDANLISANIVSGKTIFNVVGTATAGSGGTGGDAEAEVAALLGNTLTELNNNIATSLRTRACQGATKLVTVNLPNVTSLGSYAFYQCSGLVTSKLPKLTSISTQTWYSCTKLQHADCGQLASIPAQTFNACSALTELILRKTGSICTLSNVNGINNTAIGKGTGYIYVPSALVETYKTATNWATFANQFRAIEDYPDICG